MSIPMKMLLFLVVALHATAALANTKDSLAPGVYRLQSDGYRLVADKMKDDLWGGRIYVHRMTHAMPSAAEVTYAVVSRDTETALNKVVFLTSDGYRPDRTRPRKETRLCPAYAFPNWNYWSESEPYCRVNIGMPAYEAMMTWTDRAFTVKWQPEEKRLDYVKLPRKRAPTPEEEDACWRSGRCKAELRDHDVTRYEVTYATDRFALETPRGYRDIQYLTKAVSVYERADRASAQTTIEAGRYVAVLARTPEWYQVDRFAQDGSSIRGWIDRDDLFDVKWVSQTNETSAYRFRIAYRHRPADFSADYGEPVAIEVLDQETGKRVQVIRDFDAETTFASEAALQLVDANFDGYVDIQIPGFSGGAGPNSTENFFLFDPVTKRFVFDAPLSELFQISINSHDRTVTSAQRGSCCSHSSQTYRYVGKKLVLVASWDESLTADGEWVETTTGTLHKGRMRYRTTRTRAEPISP